MRQSASDLFPSFYDDRQVASGAIHIAHLDMQRPITPEGG